MRDLTDQQFGKLTVLRKVHLGRRRYPHWECQCECGRTKNVRAFNLLQGNSTSCGCNQRTRADRAMKSCGDVRGSYLAFIRARAQTRGITFSITTEDVWRQFLDQGRRCALSGVELSFGSFPVMPDGRLSRRIKGCTASVDRIDSGRGYEVDNIQLVHKVINIMKSSLSVAEFVTWCSRVSLLPTQRARVG